MSQSNKQGSDTVIIIIYKWMEECFFTSATTCCSIKSDTLRNLTVLQDIFMSRCYSLTSIWQAVAFSSRPAVFIPKLCWSPRLTNSQPSSSDMFSMSWATRQETLSLIHCFPFLQFDKLINVFLLRIPLNRFMLYMMTG